MLPHDLHAEVLEPEVRPPLELLTSTPEDLRERFGDNEVFRSKSGATYVPSATGKQDKAFGIWQVLRKGMDPLLSADEQFLAKPAHLERHVPPRLRRALLPVLSFLQTIPSLAMFGIMIPVLSWLSGVIPGARAIGIAGIGFAPAFLALTLYSLLPVVANVLAGLRTAPAATVSADLAFRLPLAPARRF